MFNQIKNKIFENYFRDYTIKKFSIDLNSDSELIEKNKNMYGIGGSRSRLLYISWDTLFQKKYGELHIKDYKNPVAIKEELFYEYFGPWEHWLENNCKGKFGLTFNEDIIIFNIESDEDVFLFNLTFSDDIIQFWRI